MSSNNGNNPPTPAAATPATPALQSAFNVVNNHPSGLNPAASVMPSIFTPQPQVASAVSFANPTAVTMPPALPPQPIMNINTVNIAAAPAPTANTTTWKCVCGNICLGSKQRCGECNKWRGGRRAPYKRKNKITNNNTTANTTAANTTPVHNPPTSEIQLSTPRSRLSSISPMTTAGEESVRSGGSSTVTTVIETNDRIREMAIEDYNATGDGGDSDEEGDGFEVVESMAECISTHERVRNDHDEIEANVSDSIDNCVYSNVTDALPAFGTLDGAPAGWVPPMPNERFDPNAPLGPGK